MPTTIAFWDSPPSRVRSAVAGADTLVLVIDRHANLRALEDIRTLGAAASDALARWIATDYEQLVLVGNKQQFHQGPLSEFFADTVSLTKIMSCAGGSLSEAGRASCIFACSKQTRDTAIQSLCGMSSAAANG